MNRLGRIVCGTAFCLGSVAIILVSDRIGTARVEAATATASQSQSHASVHTQQARGEAPDPDRDRDWVGGPAQPARDLTEADALWGYLPEPDKTGAPVSWYAAQCYPVQSNGGPDAAAAFSQLVQTGQYVPDMGMWLGGEDSDLVDQAMYLHEQLTRPVNGWTKPPTRSNTFVPVCGD